MPSAAPPARSWPFQHLRPAGATRRQLVPAGDPQWNGSDHGLVAMGSSRGRPDCGSLTGRRNRAVSMRATLRTDAESSRAVYDPTDPVGRLLFNVLAEVAEFEADLIRLRTREGMKIAKAKGRLRQATQTEPPPGSPPGRAAEVRGIHHRRTRRSIRSGQVDGLPGNRARCCPATHPTATHGTHSLKNDRFQAAATGSMATTSRWLTGVPQSCPACGTLLASANYRPPVTTDGWWIETEPSVGSCRVGPLRGQHRDAGPLIACMPTERPGPRRIRC